MSIGKTIKSLRSQGKRNTSPIKRGSGGRANNDETDPDDAGAVEKEGRDQFMSGVKKAALVAAPLIGSAIGSRMGLKKAFGKVGPAGNAVTGAMGGAGGAAYVDANLDALNSVDTRKRAEELRKTPPQSKPPISERNSGGRVGKRK